ncbi:MAG: ABC transporter permease [Thermoleophilia bacterium]
MNRLFGLPIDTVLVGLVALFLLVAALTTVSALRNRVVFRLALRNIPRRPAQTALILLGLMLATLLFSAAFATGDTMTHSLRLQAVRDLGEVDITVQKTPGDTSGRLPYFPETRVAEVAAALADDPEVDGVAPLVRETAPVFAPSSSLSEPAVDLLGMDPGRPAAFGELLDERGERADVAALAENEVFLSAKAAEGLGVQAGGEIQLFLGPEPTTLRVADVLISGAVPAGEVAMVLSLEQLRLLTGHPGEVNMVVVSNRGSGSAGAALSTDVIETLEPTLAAGGLEAEPVKQDRLEQADELGSFFSMIFLLFAQFSVAAGILLIFLIFVMLAAERKHELGMARAVGAQRGHVVRMFVYEGLMYALLASAVGSVLGVVVGWGMVRVIRVAIDSADFELAFAFNWRSVLISYLLGTVFTAVVVAISSWRVSRLNIVRAVRDLPEPRLHRRSRKRLAAVLALIVGGVLATVGGLQSLQFGLFGLGVSLVIVGVGLLARRLGLSERAAFTSAGAVLVAWWLVPQSVVEDLLPEMNAGIELFFLSGIMLVIGGVWVLIYNADIVLRAVVAVLGRIKGLPPVLKIAVTYPTMDRFRTGMTLAMISLVVFTLVIMSFIVSSLSAVWANIDRLSGGYDVRTSIGYANPVEDLRAGWDGTGDGTGITPDDLEVVAALTAISGRAMQDGSALEPADVYVQGVDEVYSETTAYEFMLTAPGYVTARDVWLALQEEPDTAVVSSYLVPSRSNMSFSSGMPEVMFDGFYQQDEELPEVYLSLTGPEGVEARRLRVIGVLDPQAVYAGTVITSRSTLDAVAGRRLSPQAFMIGVSAGVDPLEAARALEKRFVASGLQAEPVEEEVRSFVRSSIMINTLLQWFMGLGLVVGIAALGVIAARSVVERRRQIGVLRALGFQRGMVQLAFLLESSFVAFLGIGLGIALAVGLSPGVVEGIGSELEGATYDAPVRQIVLIAVVAYVASLLTTYLPARQAARVYPAEALRYE